MIDLNILNELKTFNWQTIVDYGRSLDDLDDRQWRFLKGYVVELTVAKHSQNNLIYVGEDHKDYDWPKTGKTVELKSQLSGSMYTKKGRLKKNFSIKLNNSNGTNKKEKPDPSEVCDYILVVRNDGAFVIDRDTVLANAYRGGDGFEVKVSADQITEVSGKILPVKIYDPTIRKDVTDVLWKAIPSS
jgi:hypothetical protein